MSVTRSSDPSRRGFLRIAGGSAALLAAACAPAASAPSAPSGGGAAGDTAKPAWERQWDELVAAAKKEGSLVLVTALGSGFKEAVTTFEKAFPGLTVELTSLNASAFAPKALQERKANIFNYDAITSTYGTLPLTMIPEGAMDPIRPLLFRPDVIEDKNWKDGFEAGFLDKDKKWAYAGFSEVSRAVWINTDLVKEGEVRTFDDLLNPRWKGKIIGGDPRTFGGGWWPGTAMRLKRGDDTIKRFFKDQEVVLSRDARQQIEFLIRGSYSIGILSSTAALLPEFLEKGVGKNIKHVPIDEMDVLNASTSVAYAFNRAPHPNAAKLFLNWVLSKDGATAWSKAGNTNSRRVDVPPGNADVALSAGRNLIFIDREELVAEWTKTQDIAKQVLN
jgi:ABC-type Fe3+ transport system substrate-binding protein